MRASYLVAVVLAGCMVENCRAQDVTVNTQDNFRGALREFLQAQSKLRIALDSKPQIDKNFNVPSVIGVESIYQGVDDLLKDAEKRGFNGLETGNSQDWPKAIYLWDDRKNYYDLSDNFQQTAVKSTLAIVSNDSVKSADGKNFTTEPMSIKLCGPEQINEVNVAHNTQYLEEPFFDEPSLAFCTAFKVGSDLIATAGHCLPSLERCQGAKFISGYWRESMDRVAPESFASDQVYECKEVLKTVVDKNSGEDWAIVRVNRELRNIPQAKLQSSIDLKVGDPLAVVGYPLGLPAKFAGGANVRSINGTFFKANLDTFGGNSGSPVFNMKELQVGHLVVEGILVRGESDFEVTSPCKVSKRCAVDGCNGESATFASKVSIP